VTAYFRLCAGADDPPRVNSAALAKPLLQPRAVGAIMAAR
jgi:hypothetical protein